MAMQEKRGTRRFNLRLPVQVRLPGATQDYTAQTRDVSARGIYFLTNHAPREGASIEFTLTLPPEITQADAIRVRCTGRVIRIEANAAKGKDGVASLIEKYEFLPDA